MAIKLTVDKHEINDEIERIGKDILASDIFKRSFLQDHHFSSSVGEHQIHVARMSYFLAEVFEKAGASVDKEKLVKAALCHDLGILGRDHRFKSGPDCIHSHPLNSVEEAKLLIDDIDDVICDTIATHMWPLTFRRPKYIEGYIITLADKISAVQETTFPWYKKKWRELDILLNYGIE
ncbi:MAG: HD domain-containing protein [Lachnospiraceae bacterium]|nr:HD domain-containing protein [Lachnospiraceae bacterium]